MAASDVDSLQIGWLREAYAARRLRVVDVVEAVLGRIERAGDDYVWIHRLSAEGLLTRARDLDAALDRDPELPVRRPLFGVPFAVKDNIDVAGLPTTAACPAFAYTPQRSAYAVQRLIDAGALVIGKTNLDQFATGLVGTRSPYGIARNPFDATYIPGGSSSGSAVAVASGLVSFALGTDTAGSGRVPAGFNNIIGLKPTKGLISTSGVVPACRSLDCISIFALSAADAETVLHAARGYDGEDPYSREVPLAPPAFPSAFRFGVPRPTDLEFLGNADVAAAYDRAVQRLASLGGRRVEIDFSPFRAVAALLYEGPWVAERLAAVEALLTRSPEALLPVTRQIIEAGARYSAVDTFRAMYRLGELGQRTRAVWREIDVLVLPTATTSYTIAEVEAEPIRLNANLGIYTNFANLLDLSAHAVPSGFQSNAVPIGVTFVAPAFADLALADLAARFQRATGLPLGATGERLRSDVMSRPSPPSERIELAVFGAHMRGLPLNRELLELDARFVDTARTRAAYKLFALGGQPPRPGLLRVTAEGASIEAEIWSLTPAALGTFMPKIAAPLGIGTVELADGQRVPGFLCEAAGTTGARDITEFGGWRAYLAAQDKGRPSA